MWFRKGLVLGLFALAQIVLAGEDYYKVLGLRKDATERQIKSAYRQLSKKFHPDKNPGDSSAHDKFVQVAEAYEALSDTESRSLYDQIGYDAFKQRKAQGGNGGPGHHDPFDLFSRFFGGGGHFGNQPGQRRGPNLELKVGIALRDFYNGKTTEFQWDKQQICEECEGTGAADKVVHKCHSCNGQGIKLVRQQIAPGMVTQMQMQCDVCGGRGKTIKHKCKACNGERVARKPTPVSVTIQRGMADGVKIAFENEADESPDWVAGDLYVTLVEKEPKLDEDNPDKVDGVFFRRKGDDLYWKEVLSVREAWMGDWTRNLTHLDGHVVHLGRKRGEVVQPGHVDTIAGEGMPIWDEDGDSVYHKTKFGNLYVEYNVILPDQMESGMEKELWQIFQKYRAKNGVDLHKDSGRPEKVVLKEDQDAAEREHEEL
ncbi:putative DnaJ-related protein [Podospora australis]|uniref:DnaJ-related protein n=1 Tax=Podospora australis TaxID=1536484 RepID=A0AAN6WTF6_9PEZI|nr:putative DnaJ-related protein [Podospora australis]